MAKQEIELEEKYSKYEIARILGARALQLSMNAPLLLKIDKETLEKIKYDPLKIADIELRTGILPITVKRPLPQKMDVEEQEDEPKKETKEDLEEKKKEIKIEQEEIKEEMEIDAEEEKGADVQGKVEPKVNENDVETSEENGESKKETLAVVSEEEEDVGEDY